MTEGDYEIALTTYRAFDLHEDSVWLSSIFIFYLDLPRLIGILAKKGWDDGGKPSPGKRANGSPCI